MPLTRTRRPEPDRQLADQVVDGRLADVVRLAALLGHDGVGRAREHDRRGQALRLEDRRRLLREHVIAADVDRHRLAHTCFGGRPGRRASDRSPRC